MRHNFFCHNSRMQTLLSSILNRKKISASPLLTSLIVNGNELPMYSVLALAPVRHLSISRADLVRFCSQKDSFIGGIERGSLILGAKFDHHTLCFRNVPQKSNLSQSIAALCGHDRYKITKRLKCVYVWFEDPRDTFAVWRALSYIPMNGVYIEAELASSFQQTDPGIRPQPPPAPSSPSQSFKVQRRATKNVEIQMKPAPS